MTVTPPQGSSAPSGRNDRLTQWFRDLGEPLRRFVARRGRTRSEIDDVAQEVFLRLLRYDRHELVTDARSYLFKVASNVMSEWSMRAQSRKPHDSSWLEDLVVETDLTDEMERAQRNAELRLALSTLPSRGREILRLHIHEGMTHEAIAEQLGLTKRVVKRDIVNALAKLRLAVARDGVQQDRISSRTSGERSLGP